MSSCAEVIAQLSNYLDDEVAAQARQEIEHHLATCKSCEVLIDSIRKTIRIVTESRSVELPSGLSERVLKALRDKIAADRDPRSGQS